MPVDYSENTAFARQIALHKSYSPYRFLKLDPELVADPNIGITAAAVYSALHFKFNILISDPESSQYQHLQEHDGWFYISQNEMTQKTGLTRSAVREALTRIVGVLVEEQKIKVNGCDRSIYRFLPQGGEAADSLGGEAADSLHTRVPNKQRNIKDKKYMCARGEEKYISKRRSKPTSKSKKLEVDPNKIHPKFVEFACIWEPKLCGKEITLQDLERASSAIQKLVVEDGYTFKEVQQTVEWAYNDTIPNKGGFCWAKCFKTLKGLRYPNKGSNTNITDYKFKKMYDGWQRSIERSPEYIYNERIQAIVKKYWGSEEEIVESIKDVAWFKDRLAFINKRRPAKFHFTWHESEKFINVVHWLMQLDVDSELYIRDIIDEYLEFLEHKLQNGSIDTLYAGHFNNNSELFRQFLNLRYASTGIKYTNWQRGDYE